MSSSKNAFNEAKEAEETSDESSGEYVICEVIVTDKKAVCRICGEHDDADEYCELCGGCISCCYSEEHCAFCEKSGGCNCQ